jgi:hypothetical protein
MARTTFSGPVRSLAGFEGAMTATSVELESTNANKITLDAPAALAASYTLLFPPNDGDNGQVLTTDGSGVTTWTTNGVGTVTSVAGTGTINGLSLSGTVTSTGSLTLGGTLDLSAPPAIGGTTPAAAAFTSVGVTNTTSSTSLYEPVTVVSTLTGAGVTGGRSKFDTAINSAAGSFTNALKANVSYGAAGSTSGLGSAFVAELSLSAGTSAGTYAPLELELNVPSGASTGTMTNFIYASMQGADVATMDTNGRFLNVQGVTPAAGKMWVTGTTLGTAAGALRCRIGGTDYWLPLYAAEPTA